MRHTVVAITLFALVVPDLRADEAEDRAVKAIEKLGGNVRRDKKGLAAPVTYASLGAKEVTDADLKVLAEFKKLESVNLSKTKITDAGLKHLVRMKSLRELYLHDTGATAARIADLQKALPKCRIEK